MAKEIKNQENIFNIVDAFYKTPVSPVLEKIGAGDTHKKMCEFLSDSDIKTRTCRQSPESITFGDLAVLIARLDLNSANDIAKQAIDVYFACFETGNALNCEDLKSIRDFLYLSCSNYLNYIEKCGVSEEICELYKIYHAEREWTDKASLLTIYNEIKADTDLKQDELLINLLVLPVAIMDLPFV